MLVKIPRWISGALPQVGWRSLVIALSAAVLLLAQLYYAKPGMYLFVREWLPWDTPGGGLSELGFASFAYGHLASVAFLLVVPAILVLVVQRERLPDYGLRLGRRREWLIVLGLYAAFLPVLYLVSRGAAFQETYPKLRLIETDAALFALYEGIYLVKWLAWEFFFRGYLLFGLHRRHGDVAILLSTLPFAVAHLGKPPLEAFGAVLAGLVLCRLALSGRSILPGVWLHFMVAGSMDFLACSWWR